MIYERRIEEAFKEYNEKIEKELSKRLTRKPTSAERYADTTSRQCDFYAGAKWMQEEFLKDLWHPASEEPKFGKGRLLVLINGSVSILNVGFVLDQLRNLHNIYGIEGWLYLDDLLPKEGGEQ
jgi:hypothetical protein